MNPDVQEVLEETTIPQEQSEVVDYSGKSLAELSELFRQFATSEDRLQRSKEAEQLKSAFYKTLGREKEKLEEGAADIFEAVEENFKAIYAAFKKEKAEFNRLQDEAKEANLKAKLAVIDELKALLDKDEDVSTTLPEFRAIQDKWRSIGAVPATNFRDVNNTYQLYVEQFYDKLKINRELRDLDFKKNLEQKNELCEKAEQLAIEENVVEAFNQLQKLHDAWKDLGPVAKQYREEIWDRFKAATAAVNKKYQQYFESMKGEQEANLAAKSALCEQVEAIAEMVIEDSKVWNAQSKEIENIQAQWRKIGYATRKENQKVYDRFRAACDKFYENKRVFYAAFKDDLEENLRKKEEICAQVEAFCQTTEWKQATDTIIALQKQWKEIGAVPRKKSDAVWKRFRAACDTFFENKKNATPAENDYYANLKAKQRIIAQIEAYVPSGDEAADKTAMKEFADAFAAIGFVPFKEKEKIAKAYKDAIAKAFPKANSPKARGGKPAARVQSPREKLVAKYRALEQEIATKENNILFFASAKGNALVDSMRQGIEDAKAELAALEAQIRTMDESNNKEE